MDIISSPQMDTKIADLEKQVNQYEYKSNSFSFNIKPQYMYAGIPLAIFILLALFRPNFVKQEVVTSDGKTELQTSIKKIFMWSLIFGTIIVGGLYAINYRKSLGQN